MADRKLRYPLLWLGFIALMVTGAAMVSSATPWVQGTGLALLVLPLAAFGLLSLAYYLVERFRAGRGE